MVTDPQTKHTDRGDYNTPCSLVRSVNIMHECLALVCLSFLSPGRAVCYRMIDWKKGLELLNEKALMSLDFVGLVVTFCRMLWFMTVSTFVIRHGTQGCLLQHPGTSPNCISTLLCMPGTTKKFNNIIIVIS